MSSSKVGESKELPDNFDPDQVALLVFILLVVLSIGFASIYIQCMRLLKTVRKQRKAKKEAPLSAEEVRKARDQIRNKYGKTREELAAELRDMKIVQKEVKAQLSGLERLVENASKQHETMEKEHAERMARLKMA